ncbi:MULTISPECIES: CoA transferase [Paenibacillus]|uniref:CoA transferase n=1 Tax=Paenibacillus TaxID=44249 RepID=UPI001915AF5E|nr:CoA transferase [Paenibacillus sp. EPM92]
MYPLLEGVRILEVGKSDSARYCGKILAELGAEVSMLSSIGTARAEQRDNQSQPRRTREVFDRYLNQNKAVRTGSGRLADEEEIKRWSEEAELCILGYEAADMAHLPSALLAGGTSVLAITPFGLTGPNAHAPGGDLIASHAGGYAYHLAFPSSSPEDNPPKRGPAGQSLLFAGLIGAVAAIGALLGTGRGQPSTFMDLSEQEAVASLLFEELAAYNEGHLPAARQVENAAEGTPVAGGLVGIMPCADGFVMCSPREQHQWDRVVEWLGRPGWAARPEFASPSSRMQHWSQLQAYLSEQTRHMTKRQVHEELQKNKVACFPVNTIKEAFAIEQLDFRKFWHTLNPETSGPAVVLPGLPFLLKST